MNWNWNRWGIGTGTIGKLLAGILMGAGIGTLASPDPVTLPVVGSTSAFVAGGAGLVVGGALLLGIQRSGSGCGCSGDCGCS